MDSLNIYYMVVEDVLPEGGQCALPFVRPYTGRQNVLFLNLRQFSSQTGNLVHKGLSLIALKSSLLPLGATYGF